MIEIGQLGLGHLSGHRPDKAKINEQFFNDLHNGKW